MKYTKHFEAEHGYSPRFGTPIKRKQRIRIYKKSGEYEYIDISKGLTAFNDKCVSLQYVWCLSYGVLLKQTS